MSENEKLAFKRKILIKRLKFLPEFKEIDFELAEELLQKWKDQIYALELQSLKFELNLEDTLYYTF